MTRRHVLTAIVCLGALCVGAAQAQTMDQLKQRFAERFPALKAAKAAGKIGEVHTGFVEAVTTDGSTATLIADENADRKKLYELIAAAENTSAANVADRNARRNFANAAPGEYLKGTDGKWQKK